MLSFGANIVIIIISIIVLVWVGSVDLSYAANKKAPV